MLLFTPFASIINLDVVVAVATTLQSLTIHTYSIFPRGPINAQLLARLRRLYMSVWSNCLPDEEGPRCGYSSGRTIRDTHNLTGAITNHEESRPTSFQVWG